MTLHSSRVLGALLAVVCLTPVSAFALPTAQMASDSVDDALIELTVLDQHIRNDTRSFCQLRINVVGTDVNFSAGDRIFLWVYENDVVGDDELWAMDFAVTAAEVSAQLVDRTFDCASDFGSDASPSLEIYAEARVEKAMCGFLCRFDRPETSALSVSENDDDASEDDDDTANGVPLAMGTPAERISVDSDYHRVVVTSPSVLEFTTRLRPSAGRVDTELVDAMDNLVLGATDTMTGSVGTSAALAPGTYYLRVTPRAPPDYQFYDLSVAFSGVTCAGSATETRPCGNCGMEERTCMGGSWGPWGACTMEGECVPDATEMQACGGGGSQMRVCDSMCMWGEFSTCMGMNSNDDGGMEDDDAGAPVDDDAGMSTRRDAGPSSRRDAGSNGGPTDGECSCRAAGLGGGAGGPALLSLLAMGLVVARRRRRR